MPTYDIEDIKRLNVQPGDVLVVTVPRGTTQQQVDQVKNLFETNLPIRALVKTAEVDIEVVGSEDVGEATDEDVS